MARTRGSELFQDSSTTSTCIIDTISIGFVHNVVVIVIVIDEARTEERWLATCLGFALAANAESSPQHRSLTALLDCLPHIDVT